MASVGFKIDMKDLVGHSVSVECTPETSVSYLIEKFREIENLSEMYKNQTIILIKNNSSEELTGTLESNNIDRDTSLFAVYGKVSSDNSKHITEHLQRWLEEEANCI